MELRIIEYNCNKGSRQAQMTEPKILSSKSGSEVLCFIPMLLQHTA